MWRQFCFLLLMALPAAAVNAQTYEVWVGRPTIGDHMRQNLAELMKAQQETTKSKAQMNAEIAAARKRFLATAADPSARAEVGETFARLLWAKDFVYASTFIAEGFSEQSMSRSQGLHALTGGPLDTGIPAEAWGGFQTWVNGIRASLGAKSSAAPVYLLPGDVERFRKALEANEGLYAKYVEQRDLAEIQAPIKEKARVAEEVRQAKLIEDAQTADGGVRLYKQEIKPIHSEAYRLDLLNPTLRRQLAAIARAGQQRVIDCTYGPVRTATGKLSYGSTYTFWHNAPPPDIAGYLQIDRERALAQIGDRAMTACPTNDRGAIAARLEAVLAHPWSSEADRDRARAASAPPPSAAPPKVDTTGMTPEEARAATRRRGSN